MFPLITSQDFLLPLFVFQFVWELFHFQMMGWIGFTQKDHNTW